MDQESIKFAKSDKPGYQKRRIGKRATNGGARDNAGPKARTTEELFRRAVELTDGEYNYLRKKYGKFSNAVRSLLPVGWEFERN